MAPRNPQAPCEIMAFAVVVLLITGGCYTSHTRTPLVDAHDLQPAAAPAPVSIFDYEAGKVPFTNHTEGHGTTRLYEHRRLEIPSYGDNNQPDNLVTASYYRSTLPGEHPLVIVMPIWGTYTYPSRKIAAYIQRHSAGKTHVLHVHGDRYLVDWDGLDAAPDEKTFLEVWRQAIDHQRVTVIDFRRLVDWAEQRPEINAERVGLIGFSFAATVAGTVLTQEPRFDAAVLVMGGAQQNTFLANCSGKRLKAVRAKVAADFGWDRNELEGRLEPIVREVDPVTYPDRADPRKVLIIDASRDDCMIEQCRTAMWQALGQPERLTMHYDHRRAFYSITPLGINWLRPKIWDFLEARLLR